MKKIILIDKHLSSKILGKIVDEDYKQVKKWGFQKHSPFEWLAYTTEELGELSKAISEYIYRGGSVDDIVKEAIQTATLSIKIAQMFLNLKEPNEPK